MIIKKINSKMDDLPLEVAICHPEKNSQGEGFDGEPKAIIQIVHGMSEHKERYYDFLEFLAENGYVAVIHDHRGHGASVKSTEHLGHFYSEDISYLVEDMKQVGDMVRSQYEGLKLYVFSHSMGTLVARNYLHKYDHEIEKIVLCGPPTFNPLAKIAKGLGKVCKAFTSEFKPNKLLTALAMGPFNKGQKTANGWISTDPKVVEAYNNDPLCGFMFTTNGYINLFDLMIGAFNKGKYQVKNSDLDIHVIAGAKDPVIQSEKHFNDLLSFLGDLGYKSISYKLYDGLRHELLNEPCHREIYEDVVRFFE